VPDMLAALAQTGAIDAAELDRRRAEWLASWRVKTSAAYSGDLWLAGLASPAASRTEAEAAIGTLPSYGKLPSWTPTVPGMALAGHAYLLAGRLPDAVTALRAGASTCTVLPEPFANTRAWLELGTALEQTGDKPGACQAYSVVLARWGHAKPRSLTADRARTHAARLGCR